MLPLGVAPSNLVPQKGELVLQLTQRNGNMRDRRIRVSCLVGAVFTCAVFACAIFVCAILARTVFARTNQRTVERVAAGIRLICQSGQVGGNRLQRLRMRAKTNQLRVVRVPAGFHASRRLGRGDRADRGEGTKYARLALCFCRALAS